MICLYNLAPAESDFFYELASMGSATVDELSERLGRDRTTIHRGLAKLVSVGLCYKESRTLKDGGYYHLYTTARLQEIKNEARVKVQELVGNLQRLVDNLDRDFQRALKERSDRRRRRGNTSV